MYSPPPIHQPPTITQQPGFLEPNNGVHLQPTAVVQQPNGAAVPTAPGSVWMPLPPTIPGVPPGLEYLAQLEMIQVNRFTEFIEILRDWDIENKFVIKDANGEQCYLAFPKSDIRESGLCGVQPEFVMQIVDNFKREVLTINRVISFPEHGCGGCCKCCLQECTVSTPTIGLLGTIRQKSACMQTKFDVMDANGQVFCEIDAPDFCSTDKTFLIRTANTDQVIGAITKKYGGCWFGVFHGDFGVSFPRGFDVKLKGVLLGAGFLIQFMLFERLNNTPSPI